MATMKYKDSSGNWIDIPTGGGITKSELIDIIYPVGSIYMSVNSTSPAVLFGGNWIQIKDTFLLSSGDIYTNGSTGGSATHTIAVSNLPAHMHSISGHTHTYAKVNSTTGSHTLTINEIPSHTHTYAKANSTTGSHTLTVNEIPSHNHSADSLIYWQSGATSNLIAGSSNSSWTLSIKNTKNTGGGQGHTHTISTTSTNSSSTGGGQGHTHTISTTSTSTGTAGSGNTGATGSGTALNTMPPYLVVNVWKRTA